METNPYKEKYYQSLLKEFPSKKEITAELINLQAILNLPKGTEYFISDIHGEFEGFQHIINTGSGIIREKIGECFGDELSKTEREELEKLIAYPSEVMDLKKDVYFEDYKTWIRNAIQNLVQLMIYCSSKYSRSKIRKRLPSKYIYLAEELIYASLANKNKEDFVNKILDDIITLETAEDVIVGFSNTIKFLVIDYIHIVGDIFDRGTKAYDVINFLMDFPSIDIQWGNHDVLWIGAFSGSDACLITLLRIATRYGYLFSLEKQYSLNLRSLFQLAEEYYEEIEEFKPKENKRNIDLNAFSKVQQALLIMQLKLEGKIILRNPEFKMNNRLFLNRLNKIEDTLVNNCFQLVDRENPFELTPLENQVCNDLGLSFRKSTRLNRQLKFIVDNGSLYSKYNNNLLFHGCIPMNKDGSFQPFLSQNLYGKSLMDFLGSHIRKVFNAVDKLDKYSLDLVWYCWCGRSSPLFGREEIKTFETYFYADEEAKKEIGNAYYELRNDEIICEKILQEFGLFNEEACIVNGHTPVLVKNGESPIKANKRLFVIDGGLSQPYQQKTGIAGYTLLNNSYGFQIVAHSPFMNIEHFLKTNTGSPNLTRVVEGELPRTLIKDTTIGQQITVRINELKNLLAYIRDKELYL